MTTVEYKICPKNLNEMNEEDRKIMDLAMRINELFDRKSHSVIFSALGTLLTELSAEPGIPEAIGIFIHALQEGVKRRAQQPNYLNEYERESMN